MKLNGCKFFNKYAFIYVCIYVSSAIKLEETGAFAAVIANYYKYIYEGSRKILHLGIHIFPMFSHFLKED